jgi:tRNA nucleotidyltransferase (CCA-adding enzyme)
MICDDKFWQTWCSPHKKLPSELIREVEQERIPPELNALKGVLQSPEWHPEGDSWVHTLLVCDAMSSLLKAHPIYNHKEWAVLMLSAVCHDMGKAVTTIWKEKKGVGRWCAPGHDVSGVPIAERFLKRIGTDPWIIDRVLPLVRLHMLHTRKSFSPKSVRKVLRTISPASVTDLLFLMTADCMGRGSASSGLPALVLTDLVPEAIRAGGEVYVPLVPKII